ncbi:MAG: ribbon-helix-helix domain-containing protein [Candidatus Bipolaricaulia bacterium]
MTKRSTIYFEPEIHRALRLKAATTERSISNLVNEAVRQVLTEDQEDLAAIAERAAEPTITYEALLNDLKSHGKI